MSRSSCTSDNELESLLFRVFGVLKQFVWSSVCGDDFRRKADSETLKCLGNTLHRLPVGVTAHDEPDFRAGALGYFLFHHHLRQHTVNLAERNGHFPSNSPITDEQFSSQTKEL